MVWGKKQANLKPEQSITFSRENNCRKEILMVGSYSHANSSELCKSSKATQDTWSHGNQTIMS